MFFAVPTRFHDSHPRDAIPLANGLIVVANVLAFALGRSPYWLVGPGTGVLSVITYAFAHASWWHLLGNMWVLLVFGNPANRRLGNFYYTLTYLGSALALGIIARFLCHGYLLGSSGAIFAVIAVCITLMPACLVDVYYLAVFPLSLLLGLVHRPQHWVYWFIRWDHFSLRALWAILLVPLLEVWGLFWWGWNWTNLGHLLGLFCGLAAVLMLPSAITIKGRRPAWTFDA
ncbi:MAG TPA: rhomboid family intramembrane serine protease [Pirellulales bacterium]|jgi:membrane associated rhomboid family serine protease|nr:rhomboid family intramembrane serine protease [Pirellulales bacterium]